MPDKIILSAAVWRKAAGALPIPAVAVPILLFAPLLGASAYSLVGKTLHIVVSDTQWATLLSPTPLASASAFLKTGCPVAAAVNATSLFGVGAGSTTGAGAPLTAVVRVAERGPVIT